MINVGIGEYIITDSQDETIITHALGSCVALVLYSKKTKHTAMAHIVLPEPTQISKRESSKMKPSYFATDIVPKLLNYFIKRINCNENELVVYVIGGAEARQVDDVFLVGKKNVTMVCRLLKIYGVRIDYLDTGGNSSRTVSIKSSDGYVDIKKQKMIL